MIIRTYHMVYLLHKLFGKTDFQTFSCSKTLYIFSQTSFKLSRYSSGGDEFLKNWLTIQKSIKIEKLINIILIKNYLESANTSSDPIVENHVPYTIALRSCRSKTAILDRFRIESWSRKRKIVQSLMVRIQKKFRL